MEHKQRVKIAKILGKFLVRKYKKNIIAIGIYGSTARNEDKKYSDLELICISKKPFKNIASGYKDIHVLLFFNTPEQYRNSTFPDDKWPIRASTYFDIIPVYDPTKFFEKIKISLKTINYSVYIDSAKKCLSMCHQHFLKMKNSIYMKDRIGFEEDSYNFYFCSAMFYALINRKYYKNKKHIIDDIENFEIVPKNYKKIMSLLREHKSSEKVIFSESSKILKRMFSDAKRIGIKYKVYNNLTEFLNCSS